MQFSDQPARPVPAAHRATFVFTVLCSLTVPALADAARVADEMVRIPGGSTVIGSDRTRPDEGPAFSAVLPAFELDRTPVTVAAFAAFVKRQRYITEAERLGGGAVMTFGSGQWRLVPGADWRRPLGPKNAVAASDHPVTQVSWNDASAFCTAAGKRLPSELEFEYAARGAQTTPAGKGEVTGVFRDGRYRANVWTGVFPLLNNAKDGYATTSPVGAFGRDALGLSDMAGNVWEWTSDWYRPYAERAAPWPAGQAGEKVQRGGSFLCDANFCSGFRPTARGHASPDSSHMHVGFRCARSVGAS